ncbi:Transglutaminase-like superfamily protein [Rubripirellula obstinata]|uniref:Transglutaminase-like superfamily protein n=1 Tax=Rubripirellula obstinata TaxID=406547 RepID=A0A5B1CNG9_9BACT|nr:Transglutaminase-like superfamily protein [Rubripirellula obstinata]
MIVEPLTIRLRPRSDGAQRLLDYRCDIAPVPLHLCEVVDVFGNAAMQVSFSGVHLEVTIDIEARVETLRTQPFDYLSLDARATNLPAYYDAEVDKALAPYLHRQDVHPKIDQWAIMLAGSSGNQTQPFLLQATEQIARDYDSSNRYGGAPMSPGETFASKRGACRDLAVLMMDVCRSQGIASRFVSGYIHEPGHIGNSELHAWTEVYLPGGGWRGYDPSRGIAVSDQHIPVATGPEPSWAAATEGCYIGDASESSIEYEVSVVMLKI